MLQYETADENGEEKCACLKICIASTFLFKYFLNSFFCWLLFCFVLMSSLFLGMCFCSRLLWVWLSIYLTLLSVHRQLLISFFFFFLKDTHCVWSEFKVKIKFTLKLLLKELIEMWINHKVEHCKLYDIFLRVSRDEKQKSCKNISCSKRSVPSSFCGNRNLFQLTYYTSSFRLLCHIAKATLQVNFAALSISG